MRSLIAAAAVLSLAAGAGAESMDWLTQYKQPNMHVDQLALHPYYKLSEIYDSNIYLVPRDQPAGSGPPVQSSWITRNDLGLETELPWRHINTLSLGYDFDYDVYSAQPSVNNTINQAAHADFVRAGARGLTYKAGDRYLNTTDQASSELIQRERRWMNRAYAEIDYAPTNGRLAGGVDVDHQVDKYLDPALGAGLNRFQMDGGFNVGYMIEPKTKAYVSYHRGVIHYTVNPPPGTPEKDSKSHTVAVGVTGRLSPKIEGQVEGGMTYREYDVAPIAGTDRIHRSGTVATDVSYAPDEFSSAVLRLSRSVQESNDPNNPFYYTNDALLELSHKFPRKLSAGVNLSFTVDQYQNAQTIGATTAERRDDIYGGGVWVQYDIQKWLSTGLSYNYRERDSTFPSQFDYRDHQAAWNGSLKF